MASAEDGANHNPVRIALTGSPIGPSSRPPSRHHLSSSAPMGISTSGIASGGKISSSGGGVSIEGKFSADFNAELDATFTGPLWAPVTITGTVNGSKTLLFEGNATGNTVGLVSAGVIKLEGRGPYQRSQAGT